MFTQFYKIATKKSQHHGALTVLIQLIAGSSIMIIYPWFNMDLPTNLTGYLFLAVAVFFYAISDRVNTTVRSGLEASSFGIINQLSTVFIILAGFLIFKDPFSISKIIGIILIIFSNIMLFYKKGEGKINKYVLLGILASLSYSIAIILDVNNSLHFNLPSYVAMTLLFSALIIILFENIGLDKIRAEFQNGNKAAIIITGLSWSAMIFTQLRAYQSGNVSTIAPLLALAVISNVIIGYIFLKERNSLLKKLIAAVLIIISVILIR